jgi:hypothetical protein
MIFFSYSFSMPVLCSSSIVLPIDTHAEICATAGLYAQLSGEIVYSEEKKNIEQPRQGRTKISCTGTTEPNKPTKEGPFYMYSLSVYGLTIEMALLTPAGRFRPGSRCSIGLAHEERQQADQQKVHSHNVLSSCSL